jgi:hypothetical protein
VPPARFVSAALGLRDFTQALFITHVVAGIEATLAVALCLAAGRSRWPAGMAVCLLLGFVAAITSVLRSGPGAASCGCFGSLLGERFASMLSGQVAVDVGLILVLCAHMTLGRAASPSAAASKTGAASLIP